MGKSFAEYVVYFIALFVLVIFSNIASAEFLSSETLLTETENLPYYLKDRGEGVSSSMFGTYVKKGQLLVYPFYEYYYDSDMEYSPDEFGYNLVHDYRGNYRAHEGLIFLGYGVTDWLMVEFETAVISATLERSDDDISGMPDKKIADLRIGESEAKHGSFSTPKNAFNSYFNPDLTIRLMTHEWARMAAINRGRIPAHPVIKGGAWPEKVGRELMERADDLELTGYIFQRTGAFIDREKL